MKKKYGALDRKKWPDDICAGFAKAFRVLRPLGTLVFKWNETQIPVKKVIALTDVKPTIWQRTGKNDKTHWVLFLKGSLGSTSLDEAIGVLVLKAEEKRARGLVSEANAIGYAIAILKLEAGHA